MARLIYRRNTQELIWGKDRFRGVSGPHNKGPLPRGRYRVRTRHVVTGARLSSAYRNPGSKRAWCIPLEPRFQTKRYGFGIHPDGNVPGTSGCIGVQAEDATAFWDRWTATRLAARPQELVVL